MTDLAMKELRNAPSMLPLFAKALLRASVKPGKNPQLPAIGARLADVVLDQKHLKKYRQVCGFKDGNTLPVTYPHMHAHPLFMSLLLDDSFPFPAMGLVHVRNKITQYRPIQTREQLTVECRFGELEQKDSGYEFTIITSVTTAGELVWESESTMLHRSGKSSGGKKAAPSVEAETGGDIWIVPDNIGRRYGAVSGDRNPIHLYPFTAKLLGFKRQIAHGMWSKAHALAALENQFPQQAFSVDVQFKLPLFIPARVRFVTTHGDDDISFKLLDEAGIKPHLNGVIAPVE